MWQKPLHRAVGTGGTGGSVVPPPPLLDFGRNRSKTFSFKRSFINTSPPSPNFRPSYGPSASTKQNQVKFELPSRPFYETHCKWISYILRRPQIIHFWFAKLEFPFQFEIWVGRYLYVNSLNHSVIIFWIKNNQSRSKLDRISICQVKNEEITFSEHINFNYPS